MAPKSKKTVDPVEEIEELASSENAADSNVTEEESADTVEPIPPFVENLMRLYPQYESIWVTPKGFVHPEGAPQYLVKDAKLYKNKYYNNK